MRGLSEREFIHNGTTDSVGPSRRQIGVTDSALTTKRSRVAPVVSGRVLLVCLTLSVLLHASALLWPGAPPQTVGKNNPGPISMILRRSMPAASGPATETAAPARRRRATGMPGDTSFSRDNTVRSTPATRRADATESERRIMGDAHRAERPPARAAKARKVDATEEEQRHSATSRPMDLTGAGSRGPLSENARFDGKSLLRIPKEARAGTTGPSTEAHPSPTDAESLRRNVLAQLHAALAEHFNYPMLARRHGWQGEVILTFRLLGNGHIERIVVARSSGHRLLDRAAKTSLSEVTHLPVTGTDLDLEIPIIYRLEG